MKKLIIAIVFITTLIVPVCGENRLSSKNQIIILDSYFMLLSKFSEDQAFIIGDLQSLGTLSKLNCLMDIAHNIDDKNNLACFEYSGRVEITMMISHIALRK